MKTQILCDHKDAICTNQQWTNRRITKPLTNKISWHTNQKSPIQFQNNLYEIPEQFIVGVVFSPFFGLWNMGRLLIETVKEKLFTHSQNALLFAVFACVYIIVLTCMCLCICMSLCKHSCTCIQKHAYSYVFANCIFCIYIVCVRARTCLFLCVRVCVCVHVRQWSKQHLKIFGPELFNS